MKLVEKLFATAFFFFFRFWYFIYVNSFKDTWHTMSFLNLKYIGADFLQQ